MVISFYCAATNNSYITNVLSKKQSKVSACQHRFYRSCWWTFELNRNFIKVVQVFEPITGRSIKINCWFSLSQEANKEKQINTSSWHCDFSKTTRRIDNSNVIGSAIVSKIRIMCNIDLINRTQIHLLNIGWKLMVLCLWLDDNLDYRYHRKNMIRIWQMLSR